MKIYKFRPLISSLDYSKLKEILETGNFWCSNFWDLNDPMEGVFSYYGINAEKIKRGIEDIYNVKNKYKICSFSGVEGFKKHSMWGYYAGGFKGVAIEIKIEDDKVEKIRYEEKIVDIFPGDNNINSSVKKIFTRKLKVWANEDEYRFLVESENNNYHKIGKITAIYFGAPYGDLMNSGLIQEKENLLNYNKLKKDLIKIARDKKIIAYNIGNKNVGELEVGERL